ncbi:MAG: large-conductance mechanosensitive channel protein MscL [Bacteroidetes bacterium]|nr:MAG: large-conductance mechanosensitive channel protein MscL [Bacteroidota bacterium]
MIKEFQKFIMRGNVLDLAVAVIIGGAFGKIVSSLVNDLLMPPIGLMLGGVNFSDLAITLKEAVVENGEVIADAVSVRYGVFLQTVIDFLLVAFAIFMVIKAYNSMKKKEEEAPAAPPAPSAEETLLTEIRDLLKQQNG